MGFWGGGKEGGDSSGAKRQGRSSAGEVGGKRTRRDKPEMENVDTEKGVEESKGLGSPRLNKLQRLGTGRERLTLGKSGSKGRKPRVGTSSHDARARRRKGAGDPERISDDGG